MHQGNVRAPPYCSAICKGLPSLESLCLQLPKNPKGRFLGWEAEFLEEGDDSYLEVARRNFLILVRIILGNWLENSLEC